MKIKILKMLCGCDQPLPTNSITQLLFIACVCVFSSYAHAEALTLATEKLAYSSNLGSVVLLGFGLCSLFVIRRRKQWLS